MVHQWYLLSGYRVPGGVRVYEVRVVRDKVGGEFVLHTEGKEEKGRGGAAQTKTPSVHRTLRLRNRNERGKDKD